MKYRANAMSYLDKKYNIKPNVVKLNAHNTMEHELAKCKVAFQWLKDGYDFYTEVIFKGGGRGDIYIPKLFLIIEILHSETREEALRKETYYPEGLDIKYITTEEVFK